MRDDDFDRRAAAIIPMRVALYRRRVNREPAAGMTILFDLEIKVGPVAVAGIFDIRVEVSVLIDLDCFQAIDAVKWRQPIEQTPDRLQQTRSGR